MAETAATPALSLFKKRAAKSSIRKRPTTPPPVAVSDSSGYTSSEDDSGRKVKRRRKAGGLAAASSTAQILPTPDVESTTKISADRSSVINPSNDATKTSNWYDESENKSAVNLPAKALLGSTRPQSQSQTPSGTDSQTYRGNSAYSNFISKNPDAPTRAPIGPIKAPTNIRTITVTDFAPDVCKDYKQTGFCGFGDSCKFLHAREDYKQGWELDRDWDILGKGKKKTNKGGLRSGGHGEVVDEEEAADDALLENIPFACILCKEPYRNPIVTKCGHYFCEKCALNRYRRNPSCAACGAGTGGVFNGAKGLKKVLERKRERARKRREKAREEGEEISSAEEGE